MKYRGARYLWSAMYWLNGRVFHPLRQTDADVSLHSNLPPSDNLPAKCVPVQMQTLESLLLTKTISCTLLARSDNLTLDYHLIRIGRAF